MAFVDSVDKIVKTYFVPVVTIPLRYKEVVYQPKALHVSPQFFFEFKCVMGCGGCCPRFSLDYLPGDPHPEAVNSSRTVQINNKQVNLLTHLQSPTPGISHCDFLHRATGACTIHGKQPFSCDFETLRFVHFKDHAWLGTRPFGRGWNMLRVDGQRGAKCEFTRVATLAAKEEGIRKLRRLKEWVEAFGLPHRLDTVLEWVDSIDVESVHSHLPATFCPLVPLERT